MTTKTPDSVVVGVFTFEIVWDDNLSQFSASGATNFDMSMIAIDPTNSAQTQRETLVHEVLHAAWKQTSLRTRIPDEDANSDGELVIQDLSPLIYDFIRNNREVVRWLQSQ